MKKIAFVTLNDHVPWGGSEVFWTELAKLCNSDKFETAVSVAHWLDEPPHISELRGKGTGIFYRFPYKEYLPLKFYQRFINRFLPGKYFFKAKPTNSSENFDIITKFKPDIVFISLGDHNVGNNWMVELAKNKIPYIIIAQLVKDGYCAAYKNVAYKQLRDGYLNARKILFTSFDNKKILERNFYTNFKNAEIINNPIKKTDSGIFYPGKEKFCIANVASLNINHKAQDMLLQVISSPKWHNRNVEFNFYGNGPHEEIIKNLAVLWELKNVKFNGFEKIEKIWNENHILIMPSRFEGLSLSFLEALNCKRTAIVTNVGDTKRFIDDNENGFIIKGCEVELIDEALERAWQKREDWEMMGKKANEKLKSIITEDPMLKYYGAFKSEMNIM